MANSCHKVSRKCKYILGTRKTNSTEDGFIFACYYIIEYNYTKNVYNTISYNFIIAFNVKCAFIYIIFCIFFPMKFIYFYYSQIKPHKYKMVNKWWIWDLTLVFSFFFSRNHAQRPRFHQFSGGTKSVNFYSCSCPWMAYVHILSSQEVEISSLQTPQLDCASRII